MNRWSNKVAVVTGASAGIGAAIVKSLVKESVKVVGLARRKEKLDELVKELGKDRFYPIVCDITSETDIEKAFKWVEESLGGADVLVNNAGVSAASQVIDTKAEEYRRILETNVVGPAVCSRLFIKSAQKRNTGGHIININSMAGHYAEIISLPINVYGASKYALTALTTELRHEIYNNGLNIKVTSINPGPVMTEMLTNLGDLKGIIDKMPILTDQDVADSVMYALGTPEHVEIYDVHIMPSKSSPQIGATFLEETKKAK